MQQDTSFCLVHHKYCDCSVHWTQYGAAKHWESES
jgi:hypothetical protein